MCVCARVCVCVCVCFWVSTNNGLEGFLGIFPRSFRRVKTLRGIVGGKPIIQWGRRAADVTRATGAAWIGRGAATLRLPTLPIGPGGGKTPPPSASPLAYIKRLPRFRLFIPGRSASSVLMSTRGAPLSTTSFPLDSHLISILKDLCFNPSSWYY